MPTNSSGSAQPSPDSEENGRSIAGRYPSAQAGLEHSLVVLAMDRECWIESGREEARLWVRDEDLTTVREQLELFDRESVDWPPPALAPEPALRTRQGLFPPLLWALTVTAVFRGQQSSTAWLEFGALDARALFDHAEWWRPFTALFLHADASHIVSNLVSGYFVFRVWFALAGTLRGWASLLTAAMLANVIVAAAHYPGDYRSIGASTAVFAGLGLLTGRSLRQRGQPGRWRPLLVPFAAGLTMLGLFGAGGEQTDVLAHVAGFGTGTVFGFVASRVQSAT